MHGRAAAIGLAGAFALTGCGSATSSPATAKAGRRTIALLAGAEPGGGATGAALRCGARREAARLGYRLTSAGPAVASAAQQIAAVNMVIAAGPTAAIIAPRTVAALQAPIRSLRSAGITVVVLDTTPVASAEVRAYREGAGAVRRAVSAVERRSVALTVRGPC